MEERNKSLGKLVVMSRNWSKRFDTVNKFLRPISLFIECFFIIENIDTIFLAEWTLASVNYNLTVIYFLLEGLFYRI